MKSSFRLFRVAGIDIGIHYTWIFIFVFFSWSLAQGYFPQSVSGMEHCYLLDNGNYRCSAHFRFGASCMNSPILWSPSKRHTGQ